MLSRPIEPIRSSTESERYLLHSDKTEKPHGGRPSPAPVTLDAVAREAGVSPATTSRALNGTARVRDDLRERTAGLRARVVRVAGEVVVRASTATPPVG
ncbi:regulatory protein, lacI family [Streptomyces atratus]|uniref:Regulatory protein, lacI family n=1 Tax=Streptomyces atratus TaxID=1893 RepID=A0A1K2F654_STRAR|nr:regulatory protein, lacI family [Streptomyces atratus]